jgi:hypothetical protein
MSKYPKSQAKISISIIIQGSTCEQRDNIETWWHGFYDVQQLNGIASEEPKQNRFDRKGRIPHCRDSEM